MQEPYFKWLAEIVDPNHPRFPLVLVSGGWAYSAGPGAALAGGVALLRVCPCPLRDGGYTKFGDFLPDETPGADVLPGFVAEHPPGDFPGVYSGKSRGGFVYDADQLSSAAAQDSPAAFVNKDPKSPAVVFSPFGWAYIMPMPEKPAPVSQPAPTPVSQPESVIWWHGESECAFLLPRGEYPADPLCEPVEADDLRAGTVIHDVGLGSAVVRPSMDFETYSEAGFLIDERTGKVKTAAKTGNKNGLSLVGTAVYAEHPSTEVLCLYYDLKQGAGRQCWTPLMGGPPQDLCEYISSGDPLGVEAWNVTFEWYIWNLVCVRKYGFPPLELEQCHCVMAKSRRFSRPAPLGKAAESFGTADKDKAGKALIGKLCRPLSATKNRPEHRWTIYTAAESYASLFEYCDQDVKAEDELAARIPDMTPYDRERWLADQRINARGVQVDVASLDACLGIMDQMTVRFTTELHELTGHTVGSVNETAKMRDFLETVGCRMYDLTADSVKDALAREDLTPVARRVLEIREALAGANIKKLLSLKAQVSSDGRLRNQYSYNSAATGRWAGNGVQLQNFTSKGPKAICCKDCGRYVSMGCKVEVMGVTGLCPECGGNQWDAGKENGGKWPGLDWCVEAVDYALHDIKSGDLQRVIDVWGDPATVLAGCLRGLLVARDGYKFVCCDFSAIEAVGLAALAQCEWRLDVFRTHGKIYEMSASTISGVPFEEMLEYKKTNGHDHPLRKSLGKVAELASGYGGWVGAWKAFGAEQHFEDDAAIKKAILGWRDASPEIVEFWGGQWRGDWRSGWSFELFGLEGAAIAAVLSPGQQFHVNELVFCMVGRCLYCRLPSGRMLQYHDAVVDTVDDRLGRGKEYKLSFMGYNTNPTKGAMGWIRMETYGGRLAENVTQAACADIQGEAMVRCEQNGYPCVMHTHDELIAEVPIDSTASVEEMETLMSVTPEWAGWWPIRAAGWEGKRYRKD